MQSSASRLRDTGFFLPNPRLGRVFANERHSRGFLDSRGKLTGPPSLSRLRASPTEFAQRSEDPVHLGAPRETRPLARHRSFSIAYICGLEDERGPETTRSVSIL